MASESELSAMRQAIMLSAMGLGTTSPNPPVGCVILDSGGHVAGTGFHRRKGEAHAEVGALAAAGSAARGGTVVVTLEPCNHLGVTPACRQKLLEAGIARVVIGLIDPTSRGDGGAAVLTKAGIDVEVGILHHEVLTVLHPWLTATRLERPYVTRVHNFGADRLLDPNGELFASLRAAADAVVTDRAVVEGVPGGHSKQHFSLAELSPYDHEPAVWLAAAYQTGVRSILLAGESRAAADLQAIDLVDEIVVIAPREHALPPQASICGPEFRIVAVGSHSDALHIRFRRAREA